MNKFFVGRLFHILFYVRRKSSRKNGFYFLRLFDTKEALFTAAGRNEQSGATLRHKSFGVIEKIIADAPSTILGQGTIVYQFDLLYLLPVNFMCFQMEGDKTVADALAAKV